MSSQNEGPPSRDAPGYPSCRELQHGPCMTAGEMIMSAIDPTIIKQIILQKFEPLQCGLCDIIVLASSGYQRHDKLS